MEELVEVTKDVRLIVTLLVAFNVAMLLAATFMMNWFVKALLLLRKEMTDLFNKLDGLVLKDRLELMNHISAEMRKQAGANSVDTISKRVEERMKSNKKKTGSNN